MSSLHLCPECHRHVRTDADRCPLCEASTASAAPARKPRRVSRGLLTRAAIFAGAALLAPACGGGDPGASDDDVETTSGGEGETTVEVIRDDPGGGSGEGDVETDEQYESDVGDNAMP